VATRGTLGDVSVPVGVARLLAGIAATTVEPPTVGPASPVRLIDLHHFARLWLDLEDPDTSEGERP